MGREFHIKGGEKVLAAIKSFSATEKAIFGVLVVVALVSSLILARNVNRAFLVPIPAHGGKISEGLVGLPRSVNPVLAFTDVDRDLSSLIYSGLMKYENGELIPDLAKEYSISLDGLTYTFTLKDDLRFQDNTPLSTDDIEYTIQKVEDAAIKSPRRADWADITVKKISPTEIQFILKKPYAPFLSNTTLGIIPKHIWSKIDADQFIFSHYNVEPVGSGPYKIDHIQNDGAGIPEYYALSPFSRYEGGEVFIKEFNIYFYPNEKAVIEAYNKGIIGAMARISANEAAQLASTTPDARILHTPLPRIFGIFFNQNQAPIFSRIEVRKALDLATDKQAIVKEVLAGFGVESDSPLPQGSIAPIPSDMASTSTSSPMVSANDSQSGIEANNLLAKAGWAPGSDGVMEVKDKSGTLRLEFSIATADSPDLKKAAEMIKKQWEKLGARVTIKVFEYGDLYQNIITTRKYDALLFGESIGKEIDLYAFWHSSQRNSPGLNVAMYVNSKVDKLLEDARTTEDPVARASLYGQFEKIIKADVPAVFLYSPEFIYVVPPNVNNIGLGYLTAPSDRFYGIDKWYIATDYVWKIFSNVKN